MLSWLSLLRVATLAQFDAGQSKRSSRLPRGRLPLRRDAQPHMQEPRAEAEPLPARYGLEEVALLVGAAHVDDVLLEELDVLLALRSHAGLPFLVRLLYIDCVPLSIN